VVEGASGDAAVKTYHELTYIEDRIGHLQSGRQTVVLHALYVCGSNSRIEIKVGIHTRIYAQWVLGI
jgi:hypothetical protein